MNLPEDVRQIFTLFYPRSADEYENEEEWIAATVGFLNRSSRLVVKRFLDDLLSDRHSDEDLERAWRSVTPSYDFTKGGHRMFLTEVRGAVARSLKE